MVILFDADSIIYLAQTTLNFAPNYADKSDYRHYNYLWIKEKLSFHSKSYVKKLILDEILNKFENMITKIIIAMEQVGIEPTEIRMYLTHCKRNFRLDVDSSYKANRTPNKWVNLARKEIIKQGALISETLEADDLIAIDSELLRKDKISHVIVSPDKDLKQIEGIHFDYYQKSIILPSGEKIKEYKGLMLISKEEAEYNFASQFIIGDTSDNITGIKGKGVKWVETNLKGLSKKQMTIKICREYLKLGRKQDLRNNYKLLKLG
jgi:5'-3' exonuclease